MFSKSKIPGAKYGALNIPMTISATRKDRKVLYNIISCTCKYVTYDHVLGSQEGDTIDTETADVDVLEADTHTKRVVLNKYAQMLNLYSTPGLNPMIPDLQYTWKRGATFYIKTRPVDNGVPLSEMMGSLTVYQILLIMADICFAVAASHSFDVAHTCVSEECIVVARDLSRMKITHYGVLGHDIPFAKGYARDLANVRATLSRLATRKFINVTQALLCVDQGSLAQAGNYLRHMAIVGIQKERHVFEKWVQDVRMSVMTSGRMRAAPINCSTSTTILKDMHVTVSHIVRKYTTRDSTTDLSAETAQDGDLPVFYPRGSVARGIGPATLVVAAYWNAVVSFGGLTNTAQCTGMWPNGNIFNGVDEGRRGEVRTQFFEVLGYMIGYCVSTGIRIYQPVSSCTVCLTMCENNEYLSMDAMPDAYRNMANACALELAAMRRGFEPFRSVVRGNMWSVEQIYAFFFEAGTGHTFREHPEAVVFRNFTIEEVFCIRQVLDQMDETLTRQFCLFATCSPLLPTASDPITIMRSEVTTDTGNVERVSTCTRTVSLPRDMVICEESLCVFFKSTIGDVHFNCT